MNDFTASSDSSSMGEDGLLVHLPIMVLIGKAKPHKASPSY